MRHRRSNDKRQQYPILSDKPVEIRNPQRKVRIITGLSVIALVMCTIAGGYVAATIAIKQNGDAQRQLQVEIDRRTKERKVQEQSFSKILDQYRADQCTITALLPQTPDVVDIRKRYRCVNQVTPPMPVQSPAVAPSQPGSGTSLTVLPRRPGSDPARPPAAGLDPNQPAPGPVPTPQPPAPAPPLPVPPVVPPLPSPGRQCIELLGIGVCLTLEL